ncbi:MAG TPA: hypothetical protein VMS17_30935 [Gemmataceae bacterium]|nr:hypothetical protein [Gemmataceae bacterium]
MKKLLAAALAGLACLTATAGQAFGLVIFLAPTPIPQRVAQSDAVVVGKVTGFGDKLISAANPNGGEAKVDYQIAIVQVGDALQGAKDAKEVKVGFIPPSAPAPGTVIRPIRRPQFSLTLDQEGCLFLVKHPTEDFYIVSNANDFISKKDNADYDKSLDEVKHSVQLLADATASLKGKNNDDRFLTAAMLVARYRFSRFGQTKTELIDAEESKQILLALADADWTVKPAPPGPAGLRGMQTMNPQNIFYRLGLTPQDGWTQPTDAKDVPGAAKQWLQDNAAKYRIQRFVADKKDDK